MIVIVARSNRAKQTSEILFDHINVDDRLKEMNFGIYEGRKLQN
ncbi:MAG: histidine phosphatase family protein [Thomasclavelia sp.]